MLVQARTHDFTDAQRAARLSDYTALAAWIAQSYQLNASVDKGYSPLELTILRRDMPGLRALIALGASPEEPCHSGHDPYDQSGVPKPWMKDLLCVAGRDRALESDHARALACRRSLSAPAGRETWPERDQAHGGRNPNILARHGKSRHPSLPRTPTSHETQQDSQRAQLHILMRTKPVSSFHAVAKTKGRPPAFRKATPKSVAPPRSAILLHVSDLHAQRPWFDWVAEQAERNNWAVAISGDLLNGNDTLGYAKFERQLKRQVVWISKWVREARFPLFVCSGNHDIMPDVDTTWLRTLARPGVTVDGQVGTLTGRTLACLRWDCGPEAFLNADVLAADIWLHHAPPSECGLSRTGCATHEMDFGSDNLYSALSPAWQARARLVLSGHVHKAPQWNARCGDALCLNAAPADFSSVTPKHILIDLAAGTADLCQDARSERTSLRSWA